MVSMQEHSPSNSSEILLDSNENVNLQTVWNATLLHGTRLQKSIVRQRQAFRHLRMLSIPERHQMTDWPDYLYDGSQKDQSYIYLIGRGIDPAAAVSCVSFTKYDILTRVGPGQEEGWVHNKERLDLHRRRRNQTPTSQRRE